MILPLVMPGLISSLLIGFTISLDEFIIAFFLTGTEPTLPVYIWSQLRFPSKLPGVMALGFIMLILSLVLLTAGEYFETNRRPWQPPKTRTTEGTTMAQPVSENSMVEIKSVVKAFGEVKAVNGVDTVIREGEFFSLLGPSGCGKTTLLRLIARF